MDFDLLKRLCETPSIAGREEPLRELVQETLRPLVQSVRVDALGNVIGARTGAGSRTVMVAAHMDEIGFLVRHIDKHGFLRLQPVGGFDPRTMMAQRVLVRTEASTYRGTLMPGTKPIHLLEGEPKAPKIEEFFVDLGMPAEMVHELVEIGDTVTMDRTTERMGECVVSKALDDRLGLFVMIEALRAVRNPSVDIMAVATVQEEVGLRGAATAAFDVEPDIGVALDTTLAIDIPGMDEELAITRQGAGVAIKVMDSSTISHPKLVRQLRQIARQHDIPHQMEILPRGGTDAGAMQRSRAGAAAITISIPSRYVHTVNETAHVRDIQAAIDLLARFLEEAHTCDLAY
ncbi:MAG TPA: M42 family metallopeptidase [Chloroflexota bacterium]|nr:M42 family metallopeptidase [Chloroflexota bacterium]